MTKTLTVSIRDDVHEDIEKRYPLAKLTRSEYVEGLLRRGLLQIKLDEDKKRVETHEYDKHYLCSGH